MTTALLEVLERAKTVGLLGPAPVQDHIDHARALVRALPTGFQRVIDLGSGGGLPGLVLALEHPTSDVVLLDSATRSTALLSRAVDDLGLDHCSVVTMRAEDAGRDPLLRTSFDVVVARSFGPPPVLAECAAPLLKLGGHLVVSEPPTSDPSRWPAAGLDVLGMVLEAAVGDGPHFAVLEQRELCPDRYPRRVGVPKRRPLF